MISDRLPPVCLCIIGYLPRISICTSFQLLSCRCHGCLVRILDGLNLRDAYEYLQKMASHHRMHLFVIVNQYRAIFADDTSASNQRWRTMMVDFSLGLF